MLKNRLLQEHADLLERLNELKTSIQPRTRMSAAISKNLKVALPTAFKPLTAYVDNCDFNFREGARFIEVMKYTYQKRAGDEPKSKG